MAHNTSPLTSQKQLTRRELLNYAWLASLGFLAADIAGIGIGFLLPRSREGEFGSIFPIGPVSGLPDINSTPVNYPEGKFWLVRTEKGLAALYKVCTHLECLFNWNEQEGKFICPCHGSEFDREGTCLTGPAPRPLDRFVIRLVSPTGEVLAETHAQTGYILPLPAIPGIENVTDAITDEVSLSSNLKIASDMIVQVDTGQIISGGKLPEPVLPEQAGESG